MSFYPTGPLPMIDLVGGVDAPHLHHPLDLGEGQVEGGAAHNVPGQKDTVTSLTHFIRPVNTTYKCTHQRKKGYTRRMGGKKTGPGKEGEKRKKCGHNMLIMLVIYVILHVLCAFQKAERGDNQKNVYAQYTGTVLWIKQVMKEQINKNFIYNFRPVNSGQCTVKIRYVV